MTYDVIIIWAWASWLFAWLNLNKNIKKIILEKTSKIWTKLLLSWWERANVTNMNIDIQGDYFSQNKKFLYAPFSKYSNWDFIEFCSINWLKLVEEDRGRMILESWNSKEILNLFLNKINKNNCEIKLNSQVKKIKKNNQNLYKIILTNWNKYLTKNIIISTWWKSFFQTWTTWDWYNFAQEFWLDIVKTFPWLTWITTKKDLSQLSWISCMCELNLFDIKRKKSIYKENWPLLFTHFWLSWPIIFNTSLAIWQNLWFENIIIKLEFELVNLSKKIINFLELSQEKTEIEFEIHSLRNLKEAKVTIGWINLNEFDNVLQTKKHSWLFFIWEIVDITWKTWGYNLQWCWTSAYLVSDYLNNKIF